MIIINSFLIFLIGVFIGGLFMTFVMCTLQISRITEYKDKYKK
ncbi:MAG: DUF3789 domain-containing protein [Lachnospiraceae bacterium]